MPSIPVDVPTFDPAQDPNRFVDLFAPFRTDAAALSPDGRHLAYTVHEKDELLLFIVPIDEPGTLKARVLVLADRLATPMMQLRSRERTPARVRWMSWVTSNRLVFETNRVFPFGGGSGGWSNAVGEVVAIDADGQNARVIANPRMIRRPMTMELNPVNPAEEDEEQEGEDAENPFGDVSSGGDATTVDTSGGAGDPVSLRVVGLHPTDAESILLRTEGRTYKTYEINVITGKRRVRSYETTAPGTLVLLDRLGRPRISVVNSRRASFPRHYMLEPTRTFARARPLDEIAGLQGFAIAPDTYFGQRSVPLGFDENPDLLYFASNVGRDTYGIYAVDVATGTRKEAAIETDAADLYRPEPGTFGDASAFGFRGESEGSSDNNGGEGDEDPLATAVAAVGHDEGRDASDPNRHGPPSLVVDRYRHRLVGVRYEGLMRGAIWLQPELQAVQTWLSKSLNGSTAEILEWDAAMERFLILVRQATDPGAYYVLDRRGQTFAEFVRRAPALDTGAVSTSVHFAFSRPDGTRIDGVLALPREARVKPVPLAVLCPIVPWERRGAEYSREFDALARMGVAVVQYNGRGIWGGGIRQRAAIRDGYEEAQVADILDTIAYVSARHGVSARRVALVGRGHGGFVALRALQMHPKAFRCAVTIDAIVDLEAWLEASKRDQASFGAAFTREMLGDRERMDAAPLIKHPELIQAPVFTLAFRGESHAERALFLANRRLHAAIDGRTSGSEFFELENDHVAQLPKALADQWRRIELFLNTALYDYQVKMGETEVMPDTPAAP